MQHHLQRDHVEGAVRQGQPVHVRLPHGAAVGHAVLGEARPGDDAAAVAWALPEELPAYDLTPDVLRVISLARTRVRP